MAKSPPVEASAGFSTPEQPKLSDASETTPHPYEFHVSGPRNLPSPNWRDLIRSSWKNPNYKRMVIACFIQAVYLLELDRQEKKNETTGLAPKWWKPFKYKLIRTLTDERDGSIYGAVFEWDRTAALSDFILVRPSGAPRAVLALRGTLLNRPTIWRDLEDDLRFLAWESLKGSVRFTGSLNALNEIVGTFGSTNVCLGGHSLGAGFALQVGKALAKKGIFVECHLFNPPSVSLARSLISFGEKAGSLWEKVRARLPSRGTGTVSPAIGGGKSLSVAEVNKWTPFLYVNNSDYICCYYNDPAGTAVATDVGTGKGGVVAGGGAGDVAVKLFVMSKGPQKFLEAHGLEQWWSDDIELKVALNHSKLINRQLRSLYTSSMQPSLQ
ncbi:GDSL esterase/lipase [Carex littledalei]|uniref:GDSL esterase/lipase n=1 Tax=Carex littledalei TaxID=544730 RepID=A0A833REW2_9POAL|nr:GDSL esterase/lipase [Carex littledalei]